MPVALVACSSSEATSPPIALAPRTTAKHHAYEVTRAGLAVGAPVGACRFRTNRIAEVPTAHVEPSFADGIATFAHSNAREVIAPLGTGAEQQWVFSERPAGELRIDVAVDGDFNGESGGDALFRCQNGSLATYGPATLIDARGRRTSVARTIHGRTITLAVDSATLAAAEFPVVVDPVVGAAQMVEAPVPLTADNVDPPTYSTLRHLTAGSDSWLIGWRRTSTYESRINRLNADGTVAWPTGLSLGGVQTYGSSYDGATWTIFADDAVSSSGGSAIYRRRVGATGSWLDSAWEKVIDGYGVTAAWDGTHHVVLSRQASTGTRVSTTGAVGPTFTLPAISDWYYWNELECANTGDCLITAPVGSRILAVRIKNGVVLDSTPLQIQDSSYPTGANSNAAWIGWTGAHWMVAYTDTVGHRVLVTRLGTDGVVVGTTTVATDASSSAISCSADSCRLAYVGYTDWNLYTRRLDLTGAPLDTATVVGRHNVPTVKCTSSHCLTIDVAVRGIRTSGATILDAPSIPVRWVGNLQVQPSVASNGDTALVTWLDLRGDPAPGDFEARAARFTAGSLVDSPSKLFLRGSLYAAHDGTSWVAIAADNAGARSLRRWDASLSATSSHALPAWTGQEALACNATGCLRAFQTSTAPSALQAQIIPKAGAPGSTVAVAAAGVRQFAVASGPTSFLFVYDVGGALLFRRVANDGTVLDAVPVAISSSRATRAAVTLVEDTWIVAWGEEVSGWPPRQAIRAARVSAAGVVLDPTPIEVTTHVSTGTPLISSANDGHSALVGWQEETPTPGFYGAFVTRDGRVLDAVPLSIGAYPSGGMAPAGRGRILAAWTTGGAYYYDGRIVTRIIESGALDGATCTTNLECASRYCVDGHCCNKPCAGNCESCGAGACTAVTSADDTDTCTGTRTCSASGECKSKSGNACTVATDCASGHCVDGVCCASACGTCGACNVTPGTCTPRAAGSTLCGAYLCNGTDVACPTACSDDSSCAPDHYCAADKTCVARKAKGAACAATDCATTGCRVCASAHCVEGVCCESACDGSCATCNGSGSAGSCVAHAKGADKGCSPYLCDGSALSCPTACTAATDCVAGSWCDAGKCVPTLADGAACTTATSCVSGHCVDGVCCATACDGQCEACDVAGSIGTCSAVLGAPHGPRAACASDPSEPVCGVRSCDGIARTSCEARPGAEASCEAARCVDGREYGARHCNAGVCEPALTRECSPYACGSDGRCAATALDAGPPPTIAPEEGAGCGCRTDTRGAPSPALSMLVGLTVLLRRRQRRDRRGSSRVMGRPS